MAEPAVLRATYADYLEVEKSSEVKHEFVDGAIVAMTGGSYAHGVIIGNLYFLLRAGLQGRPCRVLWPENRLRSPVFRNARYPDAQVLCGPPVMDDEDADAVTNPVAIFEVLSEATEAVDRGEKFREYRGIASVRHVVFVGQGRRSVEVYTRGEGGAWVLVEADAEGRVELPAIEVALAVANLYEGLGES